MLLDFQPHEKPVSAKESQHGWPFLGGSCNAASSGHATGTCQPQKSHDRFDGSGCESTFYVRAETSESASQLGMGLRDLVGYPSAKWFPRLESA